MTKPISLLETAHHIVGSYLDPGDVAVDATVGNGHDTVFLAQSVGASGHVFGFDIQRQALINSFQRLLQLDLQRRVILRLASHADMLLHVPEQWRGRVRAVMFNLGYLPGADKTVITQIDSTLAALNAASGLLAPRAVITVLAYPGHAGGDLETQQLAAWSGQLDGTHFTSEVILSSHDKPSAPRLFVIRKQADLL
ncbi:SAM-dependent methyltransferase [Methylomonas sp. LW13]|uniref:Class I SAM-dependent methyltransferase n=1 Tax=Methylomonas defluvii TaxID=3045149 RepID=A0ABU4UK67_9GAMM|nr:MULTISPECIES: class I SAM-dependent methyltransferase [unclassified Methylomonas]MDX8129448.1 class I SAM-dependent methyltransferase [Methylomonas sp. OY6]PKD41105.1 SAM-dependent methyltransferase [Methylomonas sp. Kb3]QBC27014.1 SAM-dependent methyltransferase [Methylomonas sp. LW13]